MEHSPSSLVLQLINDANALSPASLCDRIRAMVTDRDPSVVRAWLRDVNRLGPALKLSMPIERVVDFTLSCIAEDEERARPHAQPLEPRPSLVKVPAKDPILVGDRTNSVRNVPASKAAEVTLCFIPLISLAIPKHRQATHWLARAIREVNVKHLGSVDALPPEASAVAAIDAKNRVVGICCATQLTSACRLSSPSASAAASIDDLTGFSSTSLQRWASEHHELDEEATVEGAVFCGVLLIWTAPHLRGQRVASDMVDFVRRHVVYGCEISREYCAFSQPTTEGKIFAATFTGRRDFFTFA